MTGRDRISRRFAEDTKVPVTQSVVEIGKTVARYAKTALVTAYETREVPPLLPDYSS